MRVELEKLEVGKHYRMEHRRKGSAIVQVREITEGGGEFTVIEGELQGINDYYGPGDVVRVGGNMATFYEK